MEAKGSPSPLLKCVCLTLDAGISKTVLPSIANLLGISPNLETLVITLSASIGYHEVSFLYHLVTYYFELFQEMSEE